MSADWYYLSSGFFGGQKQIGPISESDFCAKIERGKIRPETMVSSTSKTHGRWLRMQQIPVAMDLYRQKHPDTKR